MPEKDPIESVLKISRVMSSLKAMTDPKGVSQSVTRDDERVSDRLTTAEQNRLKESATIIGKMLKIGVFEEGPEAKRLSDITPAAQPSKVIPSAIRDKIAPVKTEGSNWWDTLKKIAGATGLAGLLWYLLPKDWKDKINKWWNDALSAFLGDENKKKLDKWWNDAIKPLLGDEKTKGEISKWWDSIYNKIMDKDGKQKDKFLSVWDKIFNLDEGTELSLGQKFANILGKVIQFSIDTVARSYEVGGLASDVLISQKLARPAINVASKVVDMAKTKVVDIAKSGTTAAKTAAKTATKIAEYTTGVFKTGARAGQTWYKQGSQFIAESKIPQNILKNLKQPDIASKFGKAMNALGLMLKTASGAMKILKWIVKIPVLSELVSAGDWYIYTKKQQSLYNDKKISADEYNRRVGAKAIDTTGGVLGARIGQLAGFGLGALVGGPPGAFLGSIAGTALGDMAGRYLAEKYNTKENAKYWGAFLTGVNEPTVELQDFFVNKNGSVYKFNSKDELLGMKTGGAIDNLMTNLTQNLAKDNSVIRDASVAQVNKLDELIYLMAELIKKPVQGASNVNNYGNMAGNSSFKPFSIRDQFANQTLIPITPQPI